MKSGIVSFRDTNPNVQTNPLPQHRVSVNIVQSYHNQDSNQVSMFSDCPGKYQVFKVEYLGGSIVHFHKTLSELAYFGSKFHKYKRCNTCRRNPQGCPHVRNDIQGLLDRKIITVLRSRGEEEVFAIVPQIKELEPIEISYDSKKTTATPLVIYKPGPVPYESNTAVPYKYGATMIEDGKEVPLPSIINITGIKPSHQKRACF